MNILLIIFLFVTLSALGSTDSPLFVPTGVKLPKKRFFEVIKIIKEEFSPLAEARGRKLEILTDYEEPWAQAFARRWETDQIIVYGGAAALNGGNEDSFALLLCHEAGHLYGGTPFGDSYNELSLEGQADYWSALCFRKIEHKLSPGEGERLLKAALVVTAFYADNRNLPHPEVSTPDPTRVQETLKVHPSPQCRLDTILAGQREMSRPSCWFKN
jgi:hypothetical protein